MKAEMKHALKEHNKNILAEKSRKTVRKVYAAYMAATVALAGFSTVAYATSADTAGSKVFDNILDALGTISKYVGLGVIAFGVYEIAMSFMQQQPEAKTKGITMAVVGGILVGLKQMLSWVKGVAN